MCLPIIQMGGVVGGGVDLSHAANIQFHANKASAPTLNWSFRITEEAASQINYPNDSTAVKTVIGDTTQ